MDATTYQDGTANLKIINGISDKVSIGTDSNGLSTTTATTNELFKFLKFPEIGENSVIPIKPFLDSCQSLIEFVTILGPVFIPVRSDIGGNVAKLTKIMATNPTQFTTVNSIILSEISLPSNKQIGTDALLWLTRALEYMNAFLRLLVDDYINGVTSNDLTKHFTTAYDSTLRPYHNWIVQNLVHLSLKASPSRTTIINLISPGIHSNEPENATNTNQCNQEKLFYQDVDDYRKLVEININAVHQLFDNYKIDY